MTRPCPRPIRLLAAVLFYSASVSAQAPATPTATAAPSARALRSQGIEFGFNLDHVEALAAFRAAIDADPGDPASYRLAAASMWTQALFEKGAVSAEDFLGEVGSSTPRPANAALDKAIQDAVRRAEALPTMRAVGTSATHLERSYQVGAVYALVASCNATLDGNMLRSFVPARRAYREHQRVLALDPRRTDAGLTVGLYRYQVSTLPAWSRLLANIAGLDGGKDHGIRLVEEAAQSEGDAQARALFSLIVIYNREARYDEALRVIGELQKRFPRNRLLRLEAGSTALRAGQPAVARDALERGLHQLEADPRPRALGEMARWRYHYGLALARLNHAELATVQLRAALDGDALDWVRGRTHLELGRLADRQGDPARAATEYRLAARLCDAGDDTACARETRTLLRRR